MAKGYLYDNGDELITREDVNEVPDSSTAHAGDVLELDSNKKPKWTTPESELPSTGSASAGDVLSLDEDKEPVWSTPSGGGGFDYVFFDFYNIDQTDRVYFFHSDGSPCSVNEIISSIGVNPYIFVRQTPGTTAITIISWDDISFATYGVYGDIVGFLAYIDDYDQPSIDLSNINAGDNINLTASANNYIELPR